MGRRQPPRHRLQAPRPLPPARRHLPELHRLPRPRSGVSTPPPQDRHPAPAAPPARRSPHPFREHRLPARRRLSRLRLRAARPGHGRRRPNPRRTRRQRHRPPHPRPTHAQIRHPPHPARPRLPTPTEFNQHSAQPGRHPHPPARRPLRRRSSGSLRLSFNLIERRCAPVYARHEPKGPWGITHASRSTARPRPTTPHDPPSRLARRVGRRRSPEPPGGVR